MRHIDRSKMAIPSDWESRAAKKASKLEGISKWDSIARLWKELVPVLENCSSSKCWYCESKQDRSDMPVDHFRPKGRVAECTDHPGYWWLALDPDNFRLSCTFCNSHRIDRDNGSDGGKQDHFPLFDEGSRAKKPCDDWHAEDALLLDPTVPMDPGLLWFREDGQIVARYTKRDNWKQRAEASIGLYHLNHNKLMSRRKQVYSRIRRLVRDGQRYFMRLDDDPDVIHALNQVIADLMETISSEAEYSAAARVYLQGLSDSDHEWLQAVTSTS